MREGKEDGGRKGDVNEMGKGKEEGNGGRERDGVGDGKGKKG